MPAAMASISSMPGSAPTVAPVIVARCYLCEASCDKGAIMLRPPKNVDALAAARFPTPEHHKHPGPMKHRRREVRVFPTQHPRSAPPGSGAPGATLYAQVLWRAV